MIKYVELVQRAEREEEVDLLTHQKWSGANLMDKQVMRDIKPIVLATLVRSSSYSYEQGLFEKSRPDCMYFVYRTQASRVERATVPFPRI